MTGNLVRRVVVASVLTFALGPATTASADKNPRRPPRVTEIARFAGSAVDISLAGPVLSGANVVWGQTERNGSVTVRIRSSGRTRLLFSAATPTVPDRSSDPAYEVAVVQSLSLAASPTKIAFIRRGTLVKTPRCRRVGCDGGPMSFEPFFAELWVGSIRGPFRHVAGTLAGDARACAPSRPESVDVSGSVLLYAVRTESCDHSFQRASVVLFDGSRKITLAESTVPLGPVALSRAYAAWGIEQRGAPTIVVRRLKPARFAYRVGAAQLGGAEALAFDVSDDGKVAFVARKSGCGSPIVAWASPVSPHFHSLGVVASAYFLRVGGGRILVASPLWPRCGQRGSRLAAVTFARHSETLAAFREETESATFLEPTNFDIDSRRFAFAVSRTNAAGPGTRILAGPVR